MSIISLINAFVAANGGPIAVGVIVLQAVARAIPDSKGGVLGAIRTAAKIGGIYVNTDEKKLEAQVARNTSLLETVAEDSAHAVQVARSVTALRGPRGQFVKAPRTVADLKG